MHLADAFIQSDLQYIQVIHVLSVCVFSGNWTHNVCAANAMLYHWATGTRNPKIRHLITIPAETEHFIVNLPLPNPTNTLCPLLRPCIPLFHYRSGSRTGGWRTRGSVTVWTGLIHWTQTCVPSCWVKRLLDSPTHCYPACPFIYTLIWAWVASQVTQTLTVPPQGQWTLCTSLPRPTPGSVDFHSLLSIPPSRQCTIPQDATVPTACTGDQTTCLNLEGELGQQRSPKPLAVLRDKRIEASLAC